MTKCLLNNIKILCLWYNIKVTKKTKDFQTLPDSSLPLPLYSGLTSWLLSFLDGLSLLSCSQTVSSPLCPPSTDADSGPTSNAFLLPIWVKSLSSQVSHSDLTLCTCEWAANYLIYEPFNHLLFYLSPPFSYLPPFHHSCIFKPPTSVPPFLFLLHSVTGHVFSVTFIHWGFLFQIYHFSWFVLAIAGGLQATTYF